MSQSDTANEVVQITSSGPTMPKLTSENDAADEIVKNASDWQLSQNNSYHQLRKALNDRTAERDVMKKAYLEIVRIFGPDIFDDVPDRFNIRQLLIQEQEIQEQINDIP